MLTRPTALLALVALPAALAAQPATYRRTPGDTLRYREVTTADVTLRTPGGDVPVTIRQESLIAVTFAPGDTARAWYEELTLESGGPMGSQKPETAPILRQPFTLAFDARGQVRRLAVPTIPPAIRAMTDLRLQFDDFFLRLPTQPLRHGLAWTDSIARADTDGDRSSRITGVASYRVERDTTVNGRRALVVSMRQRVRIEGRGPVEGQPLTAESTVEGGDEGFYVFSPELGRVLGRARAGDMSGKVTLHGGPQPIEMTQTYRYRNTVTPVER